MDDWSKFFSSFGDDHKTPKILSFVSTPECEECKKGIPLPFGKICSECGGNNESRRQSAMINISRALKLYNQVVDMGDYQMSGFLAERIKKIADDLRTFENNRSPDETLREFI
jgi:hypothetical protein